MTNNIATKIVILVVALAAAIGGVLFFIKTIVSPPEDVKTINVHEPNLEQDASSFNPDTLSLEGAETRLFHLKFNSVHNALTRFRPSRVIFYVVYVSYLSLV